MSIFRQALMEYLLDQTAITDIVGSEGVYGYLAPQNVSLPYLVVTRIDGGTYRNLGGQVGVQWEFWQVSPFSKTDEQCDELANATIQALDLMQPTTMSPDDGVTNYTIRNSHLDDGGIGADFEDYDRDGSEGKVIQKPLTFRILRSTNPS